MLKGKWSFTRSTVLNVWYGAFGDGCCGLKALVTVLAYLSRMLRRAVIVGCSGYQDCSGILDPYPGGPMIVAMGSSTVLSLWAVQR